MKFLFWPSGKETHLKAMSIVSLGVLLVWAERFACHGKVFGDTPVPYLMALATHYDHLFPIVPWTFEGSSAEPHSFRKVSVIIFGAFLRTYSVVLAKRREKLWGESWKILWRNVVKKSFSIIGTSRELLIFFGMSEEAVDLAWRHVLIEKRCWLLCQMEGVTSSSVRESGAEFLVDWSLGKRGACGSDKEQPLSAPALSPSS